MHLCSKSPVQPQGKYLNNNSFICTLSPFLPSPSSFFLYCYCLLHAPIAISYCTPLLPFHIARAHCHFILRAHCHFILHAPIAISYCTPLLPFHIARPNCHFILHAPIAISYCTPPLPFHIALSTFLFSFPLFSLFPFFALYLSFTASPRVQTNELLSRYLPCGCTGLLEHKCILILQSLKLDVATRL
jgi:hypothetical protein